MSLSTRIKERFQTDPAHFIIQEIEDFVQTSPTNRLSFLNDFIMFDRPLVKFAGSDDPIFSEYKTIISPDHFTPREALARAYDKRIEDMTARLSVISWILPIAKDTRESNRNETRVPSRLWSHTRWYGEKFNNSLRAHVVEFLSDLGYLATAPLLHPFFKIYLGETGQYSNWSERHIAFAAGQGTFSLSDGFIAECGIAHRCGSVVTSLDLPVSPRTTDNPYSNCLFYMGTDCQACIKRCPAGAITEKGHNKNTCRQYLGDIGYSQELTRDGYNNDKSVAGCGLCQTKVPCEFQNPTNSGSKTQDNEE